MPIADAYRAQLRRAILLALDASPDYGVHEYLLYERLRSMGQGVLRPALRLEIEWLVGEDLVATERLESDLDEARGVLLVRLTARGADVVSGADTCRGVARPRVRL